MVKVQASDDPEEWARVGRAFNGWLVQSGASRPWQTPAPATLAAFLLPIL